MDQALIVVIAVVLMLVGMAGVIVPVVPGVPLVGLAAIGSTLVLGIDGAAWALVAVFGILTVVGTVASIVLPARQGKVEGAANSSLLLAGALSIVGFFVIPVVGLLIGGLLGLYLGELQRHQDSARAWRSTLAAAKAYGIGVLVELACALLIVMVWLPATVLRW